MRSLEMDILVDVIDEGAIEHNVNLLLVDLVDLLSL